MRRAIVSTVLAGSVVFSGGVSAGRAQFFPNTHDNIHLEMVFNYNQADLNAELGVVDLVWGSSWATLPAGMYNSWYIPYSVDDGNEFGNTFSVKWYERHHPDWLEYRCDGKRLAFEFWNHGRAPLDFANPAVRTFQQKHWIDRPLAEGYQSIAVDTIALRNQWKRCGHYDTNHQWVQQYSGRENDRVFRNDVESWEAAIYKHVHHQSPTATLQVNFSYDTTQSEADNRKIMTTTDLVFDEGGFTNFGNIPNVPSPDAWQTIADNLLYVQSQGICYMTNGEEPELTADITQAERLWVIGNYLLFKNDCTYMYISGRTATGEQDYGHLITFEEYGIAVGHPTSGRAQQDGVWERSYSNGLTLVNPAVTSATVTLPDGKWVDVNGNSVGPTLTLDGQTAQVLLME